MTIKPTLRNQAPVDPIEHHWRVVGDDHGEYDRNDRDDRNDHEDDDAASDAEDD